MELAIDGYREPDEIDDFVSDWHKGGSGLKLHDFLGLTHEEYTLWVAEPDLIALIVGARVSGRPLLAAVNDNLVQDRIAARSSHTKKLKVLQNWIAAQRTRPF
ncbi:hypothetical protein HZY97_12280 [Sphingomonas sp. R-74633]|nr:hypothetical protein [Sphingomonas sp. R-74633]